MFRTNWLRSFATILLLCTALPAAHVAQAQPVPQACDVDVDGDIDKTDIRFIADARGQAASGATDPRDPDRDLKITSADARTCTLRCSFAQCAAPGNRPPIADAGRDQTVFTGVQVTLDGSDSTDPDGDPLTYKWTVKRMPAGSAIVLSGATTVSPTFKPDVDGEYEFQLIVNDKQVDSAPDTVVITTSNAPPVANAGPDQDVIKGSLVKLDGSASSDINGDPLTFSWSFDVRPAGSNATLSSSTAVMPTFTADVAGLYRLKLLVNDGQVDSQPDFVEIETGAQPNIAPVADAGIDQAVDLAASVQLDGSASHDPDSGPSPLTYSWTLLTRPVGSTAVLSSSSAIKPTFKADKAGEYVAQLIVNDGAANSAPDTVRISTRNTKPVADAGDDQTGDVSVAVNLDGRDSFDADGDLLTFQWSFTSRPAGSTATLGNAQQPQAGFTPDKPGLYVVQLVVDDGQISSDPDTATITIAVPELPSISINDVSIAEGNSGTKLLSFTVSLSAAASNAVSVAYATGDGSATTAGSDYNAKSGTINFSAGQTSKPLTVTVRGDTTVEPDESFFVNLSAPNNATIADAQGLGTITNDDAAVVPGFTITDVTLAEGNNGTKAFTFTVTAAPVPTAQATVNFGTSGGTATSGTDFQAASGVLTFPPGTATRTIDVLVNGDTTFEGNEAFTVSLSGPAGATIVDGQGTGTITDDDAQSAFAAGDASVIEGNSGTTTLVITVTLTPASGVVARVNYATVDGTATNADNDYEPTSGTLEFLPGQTSKTVNVTVNGDVKDEASESFTLKLTAPQGATIADDTGTGTIGNDDSSINVQLLPSPLSLLTKQVGTMTVNLSAPAPAGGFTVQLTSSDATVATVPASVTVPQGQQNADFNVTALSKAGQTTVTAKRNGVDVATALVNVALRKMTVTTLSAYVATGGTLSGTVTLTNPAPAGGVTVQLSSSAVGVATVTPASVQFAEGDTFKNFTVNAIAVGTAVITGAATGFESANRTVTVTNNIVSFTNATLTVGKDLQTSTTVRVAGTAPAGGLQVRVSSSTPNVLLSLSPVAAGQQTLDVPIPQASTASPAFYVQSLASTGSAQLTVEVLNTTNPPYAGGAPATVNMVPSGFELHCQGGDCGGVVNNQYTLTTSTQAAPTLLYLEAWALNPASAVSNRIQAQDVRGGYTINLPLTPAGSALGEFRSRVGSAPGVVIAQLPIPAGESFAYFYFDPNNSGAGGSGAIGFTKPAGSGTPLFGSQPYLQSVPMTVAGTPIQFSTTANFNVGKDLQAGNSVRIDGGTAPAGGLSLRISSNSPNVLLTNTATLAGQQTLDIGIAQGQTASPTFYVQSLASSGTAQLSVQVLTAPNPGYGPGAPLTVNMVPSGFELYCQSGDCGGIVNDQYTLTTSTQAAPSLLYIQAVALNPASAVNNRIGTQDVRGGFTLNLPLTLSSAALGEYRARVGNAPGNVIAQLPILGGDYYTYFYFDPNNAGAGGSGTIGFTKPAGSGTPLVSSQPHLQAMPLTVTGTPVEFVTTANFYVGKDLQQGNYLQINGGTAPAGGLSLRVTSSTPNVLMTTTATAAGQQTMDIVIAQGQTRTPAFYVQSLVSTGTAQLTVQVLTTPNPGYGPGAPLTVNMLPSGFELYCQSGDCGGIVNNQHTINATTQAAPSLLYIQAIVLNPASAVANRLTTQDVRGGYTVNLPLTLTNAALGEFRARNVNVPGNVIAQLPILGGEYYTYFYFDPNNTGAPGNGTIAFTKPAGAGTPLVGSQPYLQAMPVTLAGTPVVFSTTTPINVGKDLQLAQYVRIDGGTAPTGGLTLRLTSSSPNLVLTTTDTAVGQQTLDVTIAAGQSQTPAIYVQSLASTGSVQISLQIQTSPNPGYVTGGPLTVNLVPSGFEFVCQSGGCGSVVANQAVLNTTTQAAPSLLYMQAWALNPAAVANNRLSNQSVRGGFTVNLPLSLANPALGEFRARSVNVPGNVIAQLPIVGGTYYTYFYFDPNNVGAGGQTTMNYTKPAGAGTGTVNGLPYAQTVAVTVTP